MVYKITNYSDDIVTIYNKEGKGLVMKPRVSVITDVLPDPRIGLLCEEINDKGDVIKRIDIAVEKKKEEEKKLNEQITTQKKLFEHIKKNKK